ncbi:MAG: hypothetical protein IJB95_03155 [Clostridia bacterium]|nr:hypothetical protein [Clostridia bacterium]MBQ4272632.1 hypothetical protein [Clostridia bacterium]
MKNKIVIWILLTLVVASCLFALCSCKSKTGQGANTPTDGNQSNGNQSSNQTCENSIVFGKKYYALSANGYNKDQYYQFNKDGTATCNITIKDDDGKETFKSTINFKWFDAGNGDLLMLHNGTKIMLGEQDVAIGFGRVMHTAKCAIYTGNSYYISEDCLNAIPNYGKLTGGGKRLLDIPKPKLLR